MLQQSDRLAITAATGMGGIGKTTLAWHYADRYRSDYPGGIWWMSANQVVVKVLEYAGFMGLPSPPDEWNETRKVQWFYQKWAEVIPDGTRLIVWDDVFDAEAYRSLQDYLPPDPRFRVLITTRAKLSHPIRRLELGVLSKAAAFRLLRKLVGDDDRIATEVKTAKALCEWVGRLPLGIELIGRYLEIHATLKLETLLSRLEAQKLKARALQQVPSEMPYRDSIEAAFELSWQTLSESAKQVGSLLSLFALAPIPKELIANCLDWDEEDVEDCLDVELVNRSLLSVSNHGSYLLHALTREFFAAKLESLIIEADELRRRFAEAMIEIAKTIPYTVTLEVIARVKAAIPHIEATTAYTYLIGDKDCVVSYTRAAWFYGGHSLWQESEYWLKACRKMTIDRFGENHPNIAASLHNLAQLYHLQGRYSEAEPLYLQALNIYRLQFGKDHPATAISLNNLAELYRLQGRYSEAEPLYLEALGIRRLQFGEDHPDTATSLNNLGVLYAKQGYYAEAESFYIQAWQSYQSQLGLDHLHSATSLSNLAGLYNDQGRYLEAEPLYLQALQIIRSQLGRNHPTTAQSLNNLAMAYHYQERYTEAEPLYLEALQIRQLQLGQDHPDTAQSLNNLAGLYDSQGRYAEAEPLYLQALKIRQSQLGQDHPDTAMSLNNLAALYRAQGRYTEAEPLYLQALKIKQSQFGLDHPDTATSLNNLAALYYYIQQFDQAEALMKQALEVRQRCLGNDHPDTMNSRESLKIIRSAKEQG